MSATRNGRRCEPRHGRTGTGSSIRPTIARGNARSEFWHDPRRDLDWDALCQPPVRAPEHDWPPRDAWFDGIEGRALARWYDERNGDGPERQRAWAEQDLGELASFRERNPEAAEEIAEPLAEYETGCSRSAPSRSFARSGRGGFRAIRRGQTSQKASMVPHARSPRRGRLDLPIQPGLRKPVAGRASPLANGDYEGSGAAEPRCHFTSRP